MSLSNCRYCNKLFLKVRRDICDDCYKEEEELIVEIQRYIKDNPNQTLGEVAEANDVDEADILQYIRDKRLVVELESAIASDLTCESCGVKIISGRMCSICRQQIGDMAASMGGRAEGMSESEENESRRDSTLNKFRNKK